MEERVGTPEVGGTTETGRRGDHRDHGYIRAEDQQRLVNRLRRIEGQVRGVQRMVQEGHYCVDTLTQIGSAVSALEQTASIILQDHVEYCVRESIEDEEKAEKMMEELKASVQRFLRV
ncbi:metal-sensitive transcriptional regulator [soil metagenome]|jgi:DNA-binding FrmR family transcriptional regulator